MSVQAAATDAPLETSYSFSKLFDIVYNGYQQGLALAERSHFVTFDVGSGLGQIIQFDSTGVEIKRSGKLSIGHCGEVSYRQANGKLYIADSRKDNSTPYVYVVDMRVATPVIERTLDFSNLGPTVSMVAADNSNGYLVVVTKPTVGDRTIAITDFNGRILNQFTVPNSYGIAQGIEVIGNEILYYTTLWSTPTTPIRNQITVFTTTGTKLYTIAVPIEDEGEGLSIDETTRTVYVGKINPKQIHKMNPAFVSTALLGMNLLLNPNAEGGAGGTGTLALLPVPFWTTTNTTVIQYGSKDKLSSTGPGSPNRRIQYFAGGRTASGTLKQHVNVSNLSLDIDAGATMYSLKGWLGGRNTDNDNAKVTATFRNASGTSLGTATIGPVLAVDRNNVSGMVQRSKSGLVPVGTRSIIVTITTTKIDGTINEGTADDLSLVLTKR